MNRRNVMIFTEKAMATYSSTLAWKIPWKEEPGSLQFMGSLREGHDWATSLSLSCIGEGNGNPLQCSCLENPRDGEPGGLPSMGLYRVGHDWSDLAAAAAKIFKYICTIYLNIFCQMAKLNLLSLENNILTLWKDQLHTVNSKEKTNYLYNY